MQEAKIAIRRRHAAELKQRVLHECAQADSSVARVALAHGLNANLVHKWRRQAAAPAQAESAGREVFVPVTVAAEAAAVVADIRLEIKRGAVSVSIAWPVAAAPACAAWLREVLR